VAPVAALALGLTVVGGWPLLAHEQCGGTCDLEHHLEHEQERMRQGQADPSRAPGANAAMETRGLHPGPHIKVTVRRPPAPEDGPRAEAIVASPREALEPYRDAGAAERDGFHVFHSELPMKMYHFTNDRHGAATAYRFDPGRPTSLLYEKAQGRYTLMGAMYTAPAVFSEDQLHQRVPLSIAQWHLHVNICVAPPGMRGRQLFTTFGLMGSLATP
jgi:hypothetical protein